MICMPISPDTPSLSLTSRITSGSVTPEVPAEPEFKEDSDCGSEINVDNYEPLSDDTSDPDNAILQSNESVHNNDEPTAPTKINLEEMVEQQQKMIDFLLQHNAKQLE